MWPFKEKPKEENPKQSPIDETYFMSKITLDHTNGDQITIIIQGKNGKHVEHVADKIKSAFDVPKVDLENFQQTHSQMAEEFNRIFSQFNKGK